MVWGAVLPDITYSHEYMEVTRVNGTMINQNNVAADFVVKTLGVTEEARRRTPGVGAALTGIVHRVALERGWSQGIHGLMAENSVAHRLSLRWGREFRWYATFERAA